MDIVHQEPFEKAWPYLQKKTPVPGHRQCAIICLNVYPATISDFNIISFVHFIIDVIPVNCVRLQISFILYQISKRFKQYLTVSVFQVRMKLV